MPISTIAEKTRLPGAAAAIACLASLHGAATLAQPAQVRDSITQGAQADRAVEQARDRLYSGRSGEDEIGRNPGVFVLIERDIFSVGLDVGLGYSNEVDKGALQDAESGYTSVQFDIGVDTRIADSFDAGARLIASETLFHNDSTFDSAALLGSVYVSEAFFDRTLILTADATGGLNAGYDFDNPSAYINGSIRATRPIPLGQDIVLVPSVFASLIYAEQSEQDRWEAGASLRLIARLCDGLRLTLGGGVTYGEYDNFYEDVLFVNRKDTTAYASVGLEYAIDDNVSAFANLRYTNRTSTLDIVEYEETDASAMIGIKARF